MSAPTQERRRFQRIPFEAEVLLLQGQRRWQVRLHDLSLKGLLVSRPNDWDALADAPVHACLELAPGVEVSMLVAIAHQRDDVLGFHCCEIDLDSLTHLRRLIELNQGNSGLLERELGALMQY
ncbi:PilZ domain-containing protein [Pseudomonas sp. MAP12]|uniref:Cyclic diguanosine monophosphate-binding protein n=1 Tax=Geopseudomonas aromaticivorans TaxID=2849492 RepID=A0ABS6N1G9_9GAMM|nr:PilZ domain-containing protein [Pseudomonas aromaticivorans]MBV2134886.1 PilZ domain-containing protein [Pseudomonas aromaticivorans]